MVPPNHWHDDQLSEFCELGVIHLESRSHLGEALFSILLRQQRQVPAHLGNRKRIVHLVHRSISLVEQQLRVCHHRICHYSHDVPLILSGRTSRISRMPPRQRHFAAQTTPQLLKPIENIPAVACRTASYCSVCFGICRMADLKRSSWTLLILAKFVSGLRDTCAQSEDLPSQPLLRQQPHSVPINFQSNVLVDGMRPARQPSFRLSRPREPCASRSSSAHAPGACSLCLV